MMEEKAPTTIREIELFVTSDNDYDGMPSNMPVG